MVYELGLEERCQVLWTRAEDLQEKFPAIVGRAVAPLPRFLGWCQRLLLPEGHIYYYTGLPLPPIPLAWETHFYPFQDILPENPHLATKGILRLVRKKLSAS